MSKSGRTGTRMHAVRFILALQPGEGRTHSKSSELSAALRCAPLIAHVNSILALCIRIHRCDANTQGGNSFTSVMHMQR